MKVVIENIVSDVFARSVKRFLKMVSRYYLVTYMSKKWSMT